VVNSRFIATAGPVFSVDQAKAFVSRVKDEFSDASHNVSAYLVGYGNSVIAHCHDDGEPSGTAGRPTLAVLRGSGLGDVAVVVTRYFGGTKLGTGGLVRAYGDAVRSVLEILPRAMRVLTHVVQVDLPYPYFERVQLLVEAHHGEILEEAFGVEVSLTVRIPTESLEEFQQALREASNGRLAARVMRANEPALVPLPGEDGGDTQLQARGNG
jgi:uncharacterized YigZ family protein